MENKNTNWFVIGGVVLVVIVLIVWAVKAKAPVVVDNADVVLSDVVVDSTEDTTEGSVNVGAPAVSMSYANALVKYQDARIQLEKTCQANPDKLTFKNGTNIMIDNRSPLARTVKVGSVFTIKGYGFKIVKLSSATLPATWYVDCGTSQNVATILIQK